MVGQFRRNKIAHVLNQPDNGHIHLCLSKHGNPFTGIGQGYVLGVVTTTTPVTGAVCIRVRWISPVPGGISITR